MMKSNSRRMLALAAAAAMSLSVAACGSETAKESAAPAASAAATMGPPTTLKVEVFDRGLQGQPDLNNNNWTRFINDNFGKKYNVNVQYVPVLRAQEVDKLNLLMSAGEAPDLCFTYDGATVTKYVKSEGIMPLDDLLGKYGKELTNYIGKDVLAYGKYNGKQMVVPAKRTILACGGTFIRQDWLDKLGMQAPTTTDELYKVLVAFKEKNPGGVSKVIPWGISNNGGIMYGNVYESFWKPMNEEDFVTLPGWLKPGNKEALQFLNKCYNEKLLSPDFAIDKNSKQMDADISNGNVGFFCANWDYPWRFNAGIAGALAKSHPEAKFVAIDTFKNADGKYTKFMNSINGINVMIPKASKSSVQAVQYLNWMSDMKNIFYLQNGEEGVNHKMVNGVPVAIPQTGDKMMISVQNLDYTLVVNGTELGDPEKTAKAVSSVYTGYEKEAEKALKISSTDGYFPFFFDTPNESSGKFGKTLGDKGSDMTAKMIYSKPADFDKMYDSLVKEYMAAGGQQVMDESRKIYEAMKAAKK